MRLLHGNFVGLEECCASQTVRPVRRHKWDHTCDVVGVECGTHIFLSILGTAVSVVVYRVLLTDQLLHSLCYTRVSRLELVGSPVEQPLPSTDG
jgi:hypothetical protein